MKKNFKVLIIDDAFFIRNLLKKTLAQKPKSDFEFNVIAEATNGKEGLNLYKICNAEIVTVDINMPQLNGIEFLKKVRKLNPNVYTIIISTTMNADVKAQISKDKTYYLPKSFQVDYFYKILEEIAVKINSELEVKAKPVADKISSKDNKVNNENSNKQVTNVKVENKVKTDNKVNVNNKTKSDNKKNINKKENNKFSSNNKNGKKNKILDDDSLLSDNASIPLNITVNTISNNSSQKNVKANNKQSKEKNETINNKSKKSVNKNNKTTIPFDFVLNESISIDNDVVYNKTSKKEIENNKSNNTKSGFDKNNSNNINIIENDILSIPEVKDEVIPVSKVKEDTLINEKEEINETIVTNKNVSSKKIIIEDDIDNDLLVIKDNSNDNINNDINSNSITIDSDINDEINTDVITIEEDNNNDLIIIEDEEENKSNSDVIIIENDTDNDIIIIEENNDDDLIVIEEETQEEIEDEIIIIEDEINDNSIIIKDKEENTEDLIIIDNDEENEELIIIEDELEDITENNDNDLIVINDEEDNNYIEDESSSIERELIMKTKYNYNSQVELKIKEIQEINSKKELEEELRNKELNVILDKAEDISKEDNDVINNTIPSTNVNNDNKELSELDIALNKIKELDDLENIDFNSILREINDKKLEEESNCRVNSKDLENELNNLSINIPTINLDNANNNVDSASKMELKRGIPDYNSNINQNQKRTINIAPPKKQELLDIYKTPQAISQSKESNQPTVPANKEKAKKRGFFARLFNFKK